MNDFHGQLDPTIDPGRRHQHPGRRRGQPGHPVRRGRRRAAQAGPAAGRRRQRRRLAAELGAARGQAGDRRRERLGPGRDRRTATTSSTTGSPGCWPTRRARTSRSWPRTSSRPRPAGAPSWVRALAGVHRQRRQGRRDRRGLENDARAGVPRGHRGADLPAGRAAHPGRVRAAAPQGVKVQIVVIHEGTANGTNAIDGKPARAVGRADRRHHQATCRPPRWTRSSPATPTGCPT